MMRGKGRKSDTEIDKEVGRRLKSYRLAADMSQGDLAKVMGITFQQVQKYEKGVNRIGPARLEVAARALNVPVSVFFKSLDSEDAANTPGTFDYLQIPGAQELLRTYAQIGSDKTRRRILGLVTDIAETLPKQVATQRG